MQEVDWKIIVDACILVSVIAIFIERSLSLAFEHKYIIKKVDGYKEAIAFGVSLGVCFYWDIDAISAIMGSPSRELGYVITAGIIAGGAKGSVHLFRDILGVRSSAVEQSLLSGKEKP